MYGTGNGTVSAVFLASTTVAPRTANIIFKGEDIADAVLTVTQLGIPPVLTVSPLNRDVTSAAGKTTFDITSNTSWSAQSSQTWCTIANASGTGNATVNVNYEINPTLIPRVATITLSVNGLAAKSVTVTQAVITTGTIQGTVTDEATGKPIPDVTITTIPVSVSPKTDANGAYIIENLQPQK